MLLWEEDVEAHALRQQGWSISAIARHLGRDRKTIRRYLSGEREPGKRKRAEPDPFEPFVEYCRVRLADDPHVWASTLLDEVSELVFLLARSGTGRGEHGCSCCSPRPGIDAARGSGRAAPRWMPARNAVGAGGRGRVLESGFTARVRPARVVLDYNGQAARPGRLPLPSKGGSLAEAGWSALVRRWAMWRAPPPVRLCVLSAPCPDPHPAS